MFVTSCWLAYDINDTHSTDCPHVNRNGCWKWRTVSVK